MIEAHENIDINDIDDIEDVVPTPPHPTHRDVLKAVSTICSYIEDLNDPISRKMELHGRTVSILQYEYLS